MADLDSLCGRKLGEFILRARIDEGGFGAVYRCDQPMLNRQAVVKVLHTRRQAHGAALQRFSREARLASMLDHPYAAHIYGAGVEHDGLLWIAMERVQGITLRDWLRARGTLSLEEFVPLFACIAEVVEFAHRRGIVHRDLKPSNIMVVEHDGQRWPKLLDFGIAKLLGDAEELDALDDAVSEQSDGPDPDTTRAMRKGALPRQPGPRRRTGKRVIGTPHYMAPEQWTEPTAVGPVADLYALGIIAYEVLTGRPPFDVASTSTDRTEELAEMHCSAPVPPVGVGSTPGLEHLFQRALAKRPEDRFATALELAAALEAEKDSRMAARVHSAARHWHEKDRKTGLLWRDEALAELRKWREQGKSARALTTIDHAFIDASCNLEQEQLEARERRATWIRRGSVALGAVMVAIVFGVFQWRAADETRNAQQLTAAIAMQAEVEQGRAALLHDELVEAHQHLAEAVRLGDRSAATAFMLARASQPLRAEQAKFAASSGRMWSAEWSPDADRVVTADDRAALLWSVEPHKLIATLSHSDAVHHALFTPSGQTAITAGNDGTVRLWRAQDGVAIMVLRSPTPVHYYSAAVASNGRLVAAIDIPGATAHVWDAESGRLLAELTARGVDWPSIAFSAGGRWLAVGGGDDVQVFDTRTWTRTAVITGPRIRAIAWEPAGHRLITGSAGGDASIWSLPEGARVAHLREIGEAVDAVAWSPDGRLVVAGGRGGAAQVWTSSGELVSQSNQLHDKTIAIEFDRASRRIAAAGANGAVAICEAATGMPVALLEGSAKLVRSAHFDRDGGRVLAASWDGLARIWDANSPYRRWSSPPLSEDCGFVTSAEPDDRLVAVPCRNRATLVWDTAADRELAELPPTNVLPAVSAGRAAIARGDAVDVYELPGGKLLRSAHHGATVTAIALAARDQLLSGAADGSLLLTTAGSSVPLPRSQDSVAAIATVADGRVLVADARGKVRVIASGVAVAELDAGTEIGLLRPSPHADRLVGVPVASAASLQPVLWDLVTYRRIGSLDGHVGRVFSARWVAGDRFLTAGGDGAVHMWDSGGTMLVRYRGGTRWLADAALSPDGSFVIGGGADGQLRFWDAQTGRQLWATQAHIGAVVGLHYDGEEVITRGVGGDFSRWRVSAK